MLRHSKVTTRIISIAAMLIIISNGASGQISGHIGIGYNAYSNKLKDFTRTNGLTLQLGLVKNISSTLSVTYGLNTSVANENYYSHEIPSYKSTGITKKYNNYSLSFQIPFALLTEITKSKLFLLTGISLNIDNIAEFGEYIGGLDPEVSSTGSVTSWPQTNLMGLGHQIGLLYYPARKFCIYGEWKSTTNSKFRFSYFEVGLKYRVFKNR